MSSTALYKWLAPFLFGKGLGLLMQWQSVFYYFSVTDSPRLGLPQETYAQVVIAANDNPNGVLELSAAEVFVEENHSGTLISVVRSAGDFGQVFWEIFRE